MDKIDGSFVCVTRTFPSGVTYCVERAEEGRDSILCTAALLGHTNCVRILVEYREADVEEQGSVSAEGHLMSGVSPLWCAASNGHYWVVDYLLSGLLVVAVHSSERYGSRIRTLSALLACLSSTEKAAFRKVEKNLYKCNAAEVAITINKVRLREDVPSGVKYCVERVKEGRDSILCTAALLGHTNCVRILVEYRGADVEELGSVSTGGPLLSGVSPLWCAAFEEHYWVVAYLLSKGANPNGDTSFYSTPLQAACELGYFHIVRLLVEHGAYIEAADNRAVTCLMLASFGGHLEIVKYLLEVGADVNSKNIEGESALHACAKAGHLEVMKLLLEHNAWMGADYSGESCLTFLDVTYSYPDLHRPGFQSWHINAFCLLVASSRGHRDMVEYLLSRNDLVSAKEKADALELLGASLFNSTEDIVATVNYWKSAINQRYVNGTLIYPKTQDNLSCPSDGEFSEVNTLEELESIELDPQEVQLQALLVMERILGPGHLQTMKNINKIGIAQCKIAYARKQCNANYGLTPSIRNEIS
ncbi:protein fem-1 homolog C-like [Macrobrachium nipponense]|uniref:protein fem-1 homolog C-like n=1 Tax=Macrobrachium nipponense TaxID=159736 RepID=UPI0030C833F1